jgi:hypothetical protein
MPNTAVKKVLQFPFIHTHETAFSRCAATKRNAGYRLNAEHGIRTQLSKTVWPT